MDETTQSNTHGVEKVETLRTIGQVLIALGGIASGIFYLIAFTQSRGGMSFLLLMHAGLMGLSLAFGWLFLNRFCNLCINTVRIRLQLEEHRNLMDKLVR